jgi:hypothetical protein
VSAQARRWFREFQVNPSVMAPPPPCDWGRATALHSLDAIDDDASVVVRLGVFSDQALSQRAGMVLRPQSVGHQVQGFRQTIGPQQDHVRWAHVQSPRRGNRCVLADNAIRAGEKSDLIAYMGAAHVPHRDVFHRHGGAVDPDQRHRRAAPPTQRPVAASQNRGQIPLDILAGAADGELGRLFRVRAVTQPIDQTDQFKLTATPRARLIAAGPSHPIGLNRDADPRRVLDPGPSVRCAAGAPGRVRLGSRPLCDMDFNQDRRALVTCVDLESVGQTSHAGKPDAERPAGAVAVGQRGTRIGDPGAMITDDAAYTRLIFVIVKRELTMATSGVFQNIASKFGNDRRQSDLGRVGHASPLGEAARHAPGPEQVLVLFDRQTGSAQNLHGSPSSRSCSRNIAIPSSTFRACRMPAITSPSSIRDIATLGWMPLRTTEQPSIRAIRAVSLSILA